MTWSYRRRIKIIPGVHLNLSKNGISTSIGVKGASVTLGKNGTYLNAGIPGSGTYSRQKLGGNTKPDPDNVSGQSHQPGTIPVYTPGVTVDNIFSADPQVITSQDMRGVKETILAAQEQRLSLNSDLQDVNKSLAKSKMQLAFSYIFLYGLIKRSISQRIKTNIASQQEVIDQIEQQIRDSAVQLDFEFEQEILNGYTEVVVSFQKLCTSHKTWDMTSAYDQNRAVTRSAASKIVTRREVRFDMKEIPDIKANFTPLYFQNGNGADLYFYPNFIIVYSSKEKFAIIGLNELKFRFSPTRFIETGTVPSDSKIIDKTWAKVNKNGTPDKRFKDNYQVPIVCYGNITLQTSTGLNEEYEFSNYEFAEAFASAFLSYQNTIGKLRHA